MGGLIIFGFEHFDHMHDYFSQILPHVPRFAILLTTMTHACVEPDKNVSFESCHVTTITEVQCGNDLCQMQD